jgi:hypothetical protein
MVATMNPLLCVDGNFQVFPVIHSSCPLSQQAELYQVLPTIFLDTG